MLLDEGPELGVDVGVVKIRMIWSRHVPSVHPSTVQLVWVQRYGSVNSGLAISPA